MNRHDLLHAFRDIRPDFLLEADQFTVPGKKRCVREHKITVRKEMTMKQMKLWHIAIGSAAVLALGSIGITALTMMQRDQILTAGAPFPYDTTQYTTNSTSQMTGSTLTESTESTADIPQTIESAFTTEPEAEESATRTTLSTWEDIAPVADSTTKDRTGGSYSADWHAELFVRDEYGDQKDASGNRVRALDEQSVSVQNGEDVQFEVRLSGEIYLQNVALTDEDTEVVLSVMQDGFVPVLRREPSVSTDTNEYEVAVLHPNRNSTVETVRYSEVWVPLAFTPHPNLASSKLTVFAFFMPSDLTDSEGHVFPKEHYGSISKCVCTSFNLRNPDAENIDEISYLTPADTDYYSFPNAVNGRSYQIGVDRKADHSANIPERYKAVTSGMLNLRTDELYLNAAWPDDRTYFLMTFCDGIPVPVAAATDTQPALYLMRFHGQYGAKTLSYPLPYHYPYIRNEDHLFTVLLLDLDYSPHSEYKDSVYYSSSSMFQFNHYVHITE